MMMMKGQKQFYFKQSSLAWVYSLHVKTVLFQAIQFSISTQLSSIWPTDRALSGATTLGQNGPGSDGIEGAPCTSQSSNATGTIPSDCSVLHPRHFFWRGVYPSAVGQSEYSTTLNSDKDGCLMECLE